MAGQSGGSKGGNRAARQSHKNYRGRRGWLRNKENGIKRHVHTLELKVQQLKRRQEEARIPLILAEIALAQQAIKRNSKRWADAVAL